MEKHTDTNETTEIDNELDHSPLFKAANSFKSRSSLNASSTPKQSYFIEHDTDRILDNLDNLKEQIFPLSDSFTEEDLEKATFPFCLFSRYRSLWFECFIRPCKPRTQCAYILLK